MIGPAFCKTTTGRAASANFVGPFPAHIKTQVHERFFGHTHTHACTHTHTHTRTRTHSTHKRLRMHTRMRARNNAVLQRRKPCTVAQPACNAVLLPTFALVLHLGPPDHTAG